MTQKEKVLKHMQDSGSITAYQALMDHNIIHLPRRIGDLIEDGHSIVKTWKTNMATGSRYIRYSLEKPNENT